MCRLFYNINLLHITCVDVNIEKKNNFLAVIFLKSDSKYCEIFKNTFFTEYLRWLLLLL